MCVADEETMDQLFLNYRVALFLWNSVFGWFDRSGVLPSTLSQLFDVWNLGVGSCRGRIMWRSLFVATLWMIWKERNNRCFQDKSTNQVLLTDKIKYLVASRVSPLAPFRDFMMDMIQRNWKEVSCSSPAIVSANHKWTPRPTNSLKLNFDGSARGNLGLAGVGGIIRNDMGHPILSFLGPAGFNSANVTEFPATKASLREAKRLNIQILIIEGDSFCAIWWAPGVAKAPWKVDGVVGESSDLGKGVQVSFSHIDGSANSEADCLTKGCFSP